MNKIIFLTPAIPYEEVLTMLTLQTPNNSQTWKNVQGTINIDEADYYIVIEDYPEHLRDKLKYDKILSFQSEPINLHRHIIQDKDKVAAYFTYEDYHHPVVWWSRIPFNDMLILPYGKKEKNLSCIMTAKVRKILPGYKWRLNFLHKLAAKYPYKIDVYGRGMKSKKGPSYKGALKYNSYCTSRAYRNYRYTFICENCNYRGQATDRFYDCILNWSIPIYWGMSNVEDLGLPMECIRKIDIQKDSIDKVIRISEQPVTKIMIDALAEARQMIMLKLNFWEKVHQTINQKT